MPSSIYPSMLYLYCIYTHPPSRGATAVRLQPRPPQHALKRSPWASSLTRSRRTSRQEEAQGDLVSDLQGGDRLGLLLLSLTRQK